MLKQTTDEEKQYMGGATFNKLCLTEGIDCRAIAQFYAAGLNLNSSLISDSNPHFTLCFFSHHLRSVEPNYENTAQI